VSGIARQAAKPVGIQHIEDLKIEVAARYRHVGVRRGRLVRQADCSERPRCQPAEC
jgi:hypothetical protein